jgi:hypothetical protein
MPKKATKRQGVTYCLVNAQFLFWPYDNKVLIHFHVSMTGSVVDRHRIDADLDPDPTFHFDADPDPDTDMDWHQNKTK